MTDGDVMPQGRRTVRLLFGAVCVLAVVVVVVTVAPSLKPAATAVSPGAGIVVDDADGGDAKACTLGFLASGADGAQYALTAGHCNQGGDVAMSYRIAGNLRKIGRFAHTVHDGRWGPDIAAIRLDDDGPRRDPRILTERDVTGVAKHLLAEDTLCFDGKTSGFQCGTISPALHSGARFRDMTGLILITGRAEPGDSGSPVYRLEPDGSASAVGVVNGNLPGIAVVVTLLRPYLEQWDLTLTTD